MLKGIVPVLQTPFGVRHEIDEDSVVRLVNDAIASGAAGLLVPAVASEVDYLTCGERKQLLELVLQTVNSRVPVIAGASSGVPGECAEFARFAKTLGATAYLVAVPPDLYAGVAGVLRFFESIAGRVDLPLIIQDLEWNGPGLSIAQIVELVDRIPQITGFKIETVPAGPKYTQVRKALCDQVFIAGGWGVSRLIEALDRGVDAMIPECSMLAVYAVIDRLYRRGERDSAIKLFNELLPVLSFTNQDIHTSVKFFKELLVRKGIFRSATMRDSSLVWDDLSWCIAQELIEHYLALEDRIRSTAKACD
jgi:4-hydroxy-tetrahydrodipicolinate synthase